MPAKRPHLSPCTRLNNRMSEQSCIWMPSAETLREDSTAEGMQNMQSRCPPCSIAHVFVFTGHNVISIVSAKIVPDLRRSR